VAGFARDHGESAVQLSTMFPGSTLAEALVAYPVSSGGNEFAISQEAFHRQFAAGPRCRPPQLVTESDRLVRLITSPDRPDPVHVFPGPRAAETPVGWSPGAGGGRPSHPHPSATMTFSSATTIDTVAASIAV
jgi:hypothetical protein